MVYDKCMFTLFHRHRPSIKGEYVDLYMTGKEEPASRNCWVNTVNYSICRHNSYTSIGECDLRIGMNEEIYYAGNIGYRIYDYYRGHGYAYEACQLLFETASRKYHMHELIITCSPENTASVKTLEKLQGTLVEVAEVPEWHWLWKRGERVKNIYRYEI